MNEFKESIVENGLAPQVVAICEGAVVVSIALPTKVTGDTTGKMTDKAHEIVLLLLARKPSLSIPEVARRSKTGTRETECTIRALLAARALKPVGPGKGGHWQVVE